MHHSLQPAPFKRNGKVRQFAVGEGGRKRRRWWPIKLSRTHFALPAAAASRPMAPIFKIAISAAVAWMPPPPAEGTAFKSHVTWTLDNGEGTKEQQRFCKPLHFFVEDKKPVKCCTVIVSCQNTRYLGMSLRKLIRNQFYH